MNASQYNSALDAPAAQVDFAAAMQDPAVLSDAAALQARSQALVAAQAEVERLYARWAELDEKRAQTVQSS